MSEPLFWLGLSIFLVAASLTAVLVVAIPALQELARAARSAEKLFDTLSRELPPTLDAIRMTGLEITDLTDDVSQGVKSAGQVVKQVDQSLESARKQAQNIEIGTRSIFVGFKAALKSFTRQKSPKRSIDRQTQTQKAAPRWREREALKPENRRTTNQAYQTENVYNDTADWETSFADDEDLYPKSTSQDWSGQE
ncbi:MAG TPA: hypothetical protein DEV81_12265 [Cyanobacteria bacterium UBA11049]|nr:hypothetical protein [Cyanobacteria bacterium UBA11049]